MRACARARVCMFVIAMRACMDVLVLYLYQCVFQSEFVHNYVAVFASLSVGVFICCFLFSLIYVVVAGFCCFFVVFFLVSLFGFFAIYNF